MADKKSILEEALLDITHIKNALNANTKEILRSVAKEEINGVVKESLEEEIYEEEDLDEAIDDMAGPIDNMDEPNEEESDIEVGGLEDEEGMDDIDSSEELDMTGASDDEVIAIYKKMSGDDEIEIVGDELRLNINEPGEYVVKLNGAEDMSDDEEELDLEPADDMLDGEEDMDIDIEDADEEGDEEDFDYEIEMDDEDESEEEESEEDEFEAEEGEDESEEEESEEDEEELEESLGYTRGYAGRQGARKSGAAHLPKPKAESVNETVIAKKLVSETAKKYNALLTEATKLKAENV